MLWIIGALLVIGGIASLFRKQWLWGIGLIIVGGIVGGFGFIGTRPATRPA